MSDRPGTLIFWLRSNADAQHQAKQFYWENDSRKAADKITELEQQLADAREDAENEFIIRLLDAMSKVGFNSGEWDGDGDPADIIANGASMYCEESTEAKLPERDKQIASLQADHDEACRLLKVETEYAVKCDKLLDECGEELNRLLRDYVAMRNTRSLNLLTKLMERKK